MKIQSHFSLFDYSTWRVDAFARYFARVSSPAQIQEVTGAQEFQKSEKAYILGRGANTLFAVKEYEGFVLKPDFLGIEVLDDTAFHTTLKVMAGEDWIELVRKCTEEMNLSGLENLAYIPGTAGAAPIQNIAAYGVAFEEVCVGVETFEFLTGKSRLWSVAECQFSYRGSAFKTAAKQKPERIITAIHIKLAKGDQRELHTQYFSKYESLEGELKSMGIKTPTNVDVFRAVTQLRKKKLPDVAEVGTNGSLFINPMVTGESLKNLLKTFPDLQFYPVDKMKYPSLKISDISEHAKYKIAAGHIFESIGWKGKRVGMVGTFPNHALVLCNYGTRDPNDIIQVIKMMQSDFYNATGMVLEPEIQIVT